MTFDGRSAYERATSEAVAAGHEVALMRIANMNLAHALASTRQSRNRWRVAFCVVALVLVTVVVAIVALGVRYAPTYRGVENWCP